VWDLYRWHIAGGLALVGVQGLLITRLLVQRRKRARAQEALTRSLRFERLVSEISTTLASVPPGEVDAQVRTALSRVYEELGFDRGSVIEFTDDPGVLRVTRSVTGPGVAPLPATLAVERYPWALARLRRARWCDSRPWIRFRPRERSTARTFSPSAPTPSSACLWRSAAPSSGAYRSRTSAPPWPTGPRR